MNKVNLRFVGTYFQQDINIDLSTPRTVRDVLEAAKSQYSQGPITFNYLGSSYSNKDIGNVLVTFDQSPRPTRQQGPVSISLAEQRVSKGHTVFQYYIERNMQFGNRTYRLRLNIDNHFTPIDTLPKNNEWQLQDGDYVVFRLVTIGDLIAANANQLA